MKEPFYTTAEVIKAVNISKNTLIRWEQSGNVPSPHRDGRGWRLWSKSDLHKIIEFKKSVDRKYTTRSDSKRLHVNIIGYGNQAEVWAKNLRDSGANVTVLLRDNSKSIRLASNDGFEVDRISTAIKQEGVFCLLIPDEKHAEFFNEYNDIINKKSVFIFAHGFSMGYQNTELKINKILLAPKAIARVMRTNYLHNHATATAVCYDDKYKDIVEKLARHIGLAPLIKTDFWEETVSDLFTEQVLLCGGVPALIIKAFNILIEKGINPKLALLECLHELTYILEVVKEKGMSAMLESISPIAKLGGLTAWNNISSGKDIEKLLDEHINNILSKDFLNKVMDSNDSCNTIKDNLKLFDKTLFELQV